MKLEVLYHWKFPAGRLMWAARTGPRNLDLGTKHYAVPVVAVGMEYEHILALVKGSAMTDEHSSHSWTELLSYKESGSASGYAPVRSWKMAIFVERERCMLQAQAGMEHLHVRCIKGDRRLRVGHAVPAYATLAQNRV